MYNAFLQLPEQAGQSQLLAEPVRRGGGSQFGETQRGDGRGCCRHSKTYTEDGSLPYPPVRYYELT